MTRLYEFALGFLQRRCSHPGDQVVADILQHDYLPTVVRWCRICGAHAIGRDGDRRDNWRRPEPVR